MIQSGSLVPRFSLFLLTGCAAVAHAQYSGAKTCRGCHQEQAELQAKSGHARSLSLAANHGLAAKLAGAPGEWAFGAGTQAVTIVSRLDSETYLEHGLSYYPSLGRMALTPGHSNAKGVRYQTFSPGGEILRCFLCHSTGTPAVNDAGEIQPQEPGVRCETCHGPGATHAAKPERANIVNPKRLSAEEQNQMCGSCHRKPAAAGGDTDYRNPWNARHQPLYLAKSRCFQQSLGSVSCNLCHPPHGGSAAVNVCARCHEQPKHGARTLVSGKRCESCHMPDVRPMPGLAFANHWIGVYRAGETLVPRR